MKTNINLMSKVFILTVDLAIKVGVLNMIK